MGGTFMSMPGDYRDYFIRNLHDALSGHSSSSVLEAVRYSEQVNSNNHHREKMHQRLPCRQHVQDAVSSGFLSKGNGPKPI